MVDTSHKASVLRTASAEGLLRLSHAALQALNDDLSPKGPVLMIAQVAGIQAAKRAPSLVPLCPPKPLDHVDVVLQIQQDPPALLARATVKTCWSAGVELEALAAVQGALLTAYDMLLEVDRSMELASVRLVRKSGGESGRWSRE